MHQIIDLRSDTVTRPSQGMMNAMLEARVGDDVLGDDPTVQELEAMMAEMFGKEDAIFCPSGTMTNQVAVKVHTQPGNEIICDVTSHVYKFEAGGIGFNSGCSVKLIDGDRGRITPVQIAAQINPDNVHYPQTRLVVVENTSNLGGGSFYQFSQLQTISALCKSHGLALHLDGARIFNALAETGESPLAHGQLFDSVSVCFSKGLGAPVGSVLIGTRDFIVQARRIRKVFGGGMRQSGFLAAAAIFAMNNNVSRLKEDHARAASIAGFLSGMSFVSEVLPASTNIVIFRLNEQYSQASFLHRLNEKGLWAVGFGSDMIRLVTHLDFTDEMMEESFRIFRSLC